MAAINIKICMGTMCYMMGGADLRAAIEGLPEDIRQHIDIGYSPCLGLCDKKGESPYIMLNDKIIPRISASGLMNIIREELDNI